MRNYEKKKYLSAKFRHKIVFLEKVGEDNDELEVFHEAYAEIMPVSENNFQEFDGVNFGHIMVEEYFIITCRYINGINCRMRVGFNDRLFTIKRIVNPYELNHFLKLLVLEITER